MLLIIELFDIKLTIAMRRYLMMVIFELGIGLQVERIKLTLE